ncbi:MAG TPA: carbohydrate kinase [Kineosporiaceae bacterium]|nr:carbohydrate kinase [Kineosporiaceae bacterium]
MDGVLVVGEALVDIVERPGSPTAEHPGGSPANVALGLARLGRTADLLTRIGNDPRGRAVRAHLECSGVRLVPGSVTDEPTSTATAHLDPAGVASYDFHLDWRLPDSQVHESACCVHTGSIAAFLPPGGDAVLALVEKVADRATVSYDPNVRPTLMGDPASARQRVETFVRCADVVKVSDEDLAWLAPGEDPVAVAQSWLASGPAIVVVTRGGRGAVGLCAAGRLDVPAPAITVVDTLGAGDSFMAGLLDHLTALDLLGPQRLADLRAISLPDLDGMLRHAVRIAAITCTRAGANPPTRAELEAWSG